MCGISINEAERPSLWPNHHAGAHQSCEQGSAVWGLTLGAVSCMLARGAARNGTTFTGHASNLLTWRPIAIATLHRLRLKGGASSKFLYMSGCASGWRVSVSATNPLAANSMQMTLTQGGFYPSRYKRLFGVEAAIYLAINQHRRQSTTAISQTLSAQYSRECSWQCHGRRRQREWRRCGENSTSKHSRRPHRLLCSVQLGCILQLDRGRRAAPLTSGWR